MPGRGTLIVVYASHTPLTFWVSPGCLWGAFGCFGLPQAFKMISKMYPRTQRCYQNDLPNNTKVVSKITQTTLRERILQYFPNHADSATIRTSTALLQTPLKPSALSRPSLKPRTRAAGCREADRIRRTSAEVAGRARLWANACKVL